MNYGLVEDPRPIVGIGWSFMDTTMELSGFPEENTKMEAELVRESPGGPVLRAMVALSRLGHPTKLISCVGDDGAGNGIVAYLLEQGVGAEFIQSASGTSHRSSVWINRLNGSRTISYAGTVPSLVGTPPGSLWDAVAIVLDGREYVASVQALEEAPADALCSIDVEGDPKENMGDLISKCGCVVIPKGMLELLADGSGHSTPLRYVEHLLGDRAHLVAVTGAGAGAICFSGDDAWTQPGFRVPTVDSNGAGDSFHAGLVYALLNGRGPRGATRIGAAVAAMKCAARADTGLPTQAELFSFIRDHKGEAEPASYTKTTGEL